MVCGGKQQIKIMLKTGDQLVEEAEALKMLRLY